MNQRSKAVAALSLAMLLFVSLTPANSIAQVVTQATIFVTPDPAHPGDTVSIRGRNPDADGAGGCDLTVAQDNGKAFDNELIGGSCSVDKLGSISGSFTVPADLGRTTVTVGVCVSTCLDVDVAGPAASASLDVEPVVDDVVVPSISVSPNPAHPGDLVTIVGSGPGSADDQNCGLEVIPVGAEGALSNEVIGGACSISSAGVVGGSFALPSDAPPGTVTVKVCEAECLNPDGVAGWLASTSFVVEAVVPDPGISVSPNPAMQGNTVTIAGNAPGSADATTCVVALDDVPIDAACSIDATAVINGSFTVSSNLQPGTVTVSVCQPACQDSDGIHWRASASLAIGSAPATSRAATDGPTHDVVRIPDLTALTMQDAEKVIKQAGLGMQVSGDHSGLVSEQSPIAGSMVAPDTTVLVTLSADGPLPPESSPNRLLLAAIAVVMFLTMGGAALTIRYRVRRRRELRWVDEHVSLIPEPGFRIDRAEPINADDADLEIKVVVNPHDELVSIVEVQR